MAIITYPLNGIDYNAENAETYLCTRTSGVYSADGNFQASVTGDRQISISAGLAWIQNTDFAGKSVCNTESVALEIPIADGARPRIDRIVLRFDKALNASSIVLKQGTPSSTPAAPTVERTELVYELGLYTVQVPAASTIVSEGNITSTLLDEAVCGLMRDGVTGIPTAQLQEQVTALLTDLRVEFENQLDLQGYGFDAWFDTIKGKLGDDPATALQAQVDDLQAAVGGMPLELSTGANSVQVVADENRIANVTIKGFTVQEGSGDASPANVRPIKNAGEALKIEINVDSDPTSISLNAPLHEGDTLETSVDYDGEFKCVETHKKGTYIVTGNELVETNDGWANGSIAIVDALYNAVNVEGYETVASIKCSHLKTLSPVDVVNKGQVGCGQGSNTKVYLYFGSDYSTKELAVQYCKQQYSAGTPVTIEYDLATPEVYTTAPIEIKNPRGTFTVSSEEGTVCTPHIRSVPTAEETGALPASGSVYSTSAPINTGKKWIDGSPIYIQVFTFNSQKLPQLQYSTLIPLSSFDGLSHFVDIRGHIYLEGGNYPIILPCAIGDSVVDVQCSARGVELFRNKLSTTTIEGNTPYPTGSTNNITLVVEYSKLGG